MTASSSRPSASTTGPMSSTATRMNRNDAPHRAASARSMGFCRGVMPVHPPPPGGREPSPLAVSKAPPQLVGERAELDALGQEGGAAGLQRGLLGVAAPG